MKTKLCCDVLQCLAGKTLATAESLTGGGIGAAITGTPGASTVYVGGVVSYTNDVKNRILDVPEAILKEQGAVSAPTALAMAEGVRQLLKADVSISVTGLAGPGGDEYGNPVGTVFIGYADDKTALTEHHVFSGSREEVREQTILAALKLILKQNK